MLTISRGRQTSRFIKNECGVIFHLQMEVGIEFLEHHQLGNKKIILKILMQDTNLKFGASDSEKVCLCFFKHFNYYIPSMKFQLCTAQESVV